MKKRLVIFQHTLAICPLSQCTPDSHQLVQGGAKNRRKLPRLVSVSRENANIYRYGEILISVCAREIIY